MTNSIQVDKPNEIKIHVTPFANHILMVQYHTHGLQTH
jgi:hypothetical protein